MSLIHELNKEVPFSLSEFCIDGVGNTPDSVKEKIWRYHICPVINVRHDIDLPLTASEKSCYRPFKWEIEQGRSGNSEHTFKGLGACDWTFYNKKHKTPENLSKLYYSLMAHTKYTRIAIYKTFIHCDYGIDDGYRYLFDAKSDGWKFVDKVEML